MLGTYYNMVTTQTWALMRLKDLFGNVSKSGHVFGDWWILLHSTHRPSGRVRNPVLAISECWTLILHVSQELSDENENFGNLSKSGHLFGNVSKSGHVFGESWILSHGAQESLEELKIVPEQCQSAGHSPCGRFNYFGRIWKIMKIRAPFRRGHLFGRMCIGPQRCPGTDGMVRNHSKSTTRVLDTLMMHSRRLWGGIEKTSIFHEKVRACFRRIVKVRACFRSDLRNDLQTAWAILEPNSRSKTC